MAPSSTTGDMSLSSRRYGTQVERTTNLGVSQVVNGSTTPKSKVGSRLSEDPLAALCIDDETLKKLQELQ